MPLRVRIRTIFRAVLFVTAITIIADYNKREWGWLSQKDNLENGYNGEYYAIRVHSAYLKDKGKLSENVGFVTLTEFEIGPDVKIHYTQHLATLIKKIARKYKKIVLNLDMSKISKSEKTLSSLFLRVLDYENQSRLNKGLSKIEVYYYASQKKLDGFQV